jgi:protein-S-isoprenylcysteine O-methyltransferase Ste14
VRHPSLYQTLSTAAIADGRQFFLHDAEAKNLVTHGTYSRIRNPIYFFGTFVFVGLSLLLGRPWLLLLVVPVLILQIIRARAESRVLEEHFGEEYRRYRASTWF